MPRNPPRAKTATQRPTPAEPVATPAPSAPTAPWIAAPTAAPQVQPAPEPAPRVERAVSLNGVPVTIDRENLREAGLIVPEDPVTGLLEEFRIVKRELLADARASGTATARRILVCSPLPGEGKTYCAANLAIALAAERNIEVVLVDAEFINPSIARRFGLSPARGLMDALSRTNINPEDLVSPTDIDGVVTTRRHRIPEESG